MGCEVQETARSGWVHVHTHLLQRVFVAHIVRIATPSNEPFLCSGGARGVCLPWTRHVLANCRACTASAHLMPTPLQHKPVACAPTLQLGARVA
jgi:hypothetical protein